MKTVTYSHDATTKNWERFKPAKATEVGGDKPLDLAKDLLCGPIYLPLGTSKEDFTVTINR